MVKTEKQTFMATTIYRLTENDVRRMVEEAAVRLLREFDWDEEWQEYMDEHPDEYKDGKRVGDPFKKKSSGSSGKDRKNGKRDNIRDSLIQEPTIARSVAKYADDMGADINDKLVSDKRKEAKPGGKRNATVSDEMAQGVGMTPPLGMSPGMPSAMPPMGPM